MFYKCGNKFQTICMKALQYKNVLLQTSFYYYLGHWAFLRYTYLWRYEANARGGEGEKLKAALTPLGVPPLRQISASIG